MKRNKNKNRTIGFDTIEINLVYYILSLQLMHIYSTSTSYSVVRPLITFCMDKVNMDKMVEDKQNKNQGFVLDIIGSNLILNKAK